MISFFRQYLNLRNRNGELKDLLLRVLVVVDKNDHSIASSMLEKIILDASAITVAIK